MLKQITTAFFLLCSVLVTGQDFKKIEEEIKSLSGDEIKEYWIALNQVDQTITTDYNPKFYERNIVNLYKTAALIKYHGYPVVKEYGYPAYVTPWLAWVHCASASLKHYTFPIILEGRDKQQLADGQFPDYFVGGFISQNYGLDMVYDKDFYTDDISPITRFLYRMEEDRHEIDLKELQRLSEEAIKLLYPQSVMEIGKWELLQHGTKTYFTIAKIKNEFYLVYEITGTKYYSGIKPAGNTTYDFVYGYGFYSLVVDGTMQFKDHTGKIVKTLQPVKI